HEAQRRTSDGNATVDQSELPMVYLPPALTLGRSLPAWILWIMTLKSAVGPFGSGSWGVWHMMQSSILRREPPWKASWSWHLLQDAVRMTSRAAGLPPAGTQVKVVSA